MARRPKKKSPRSEYQKEYYIRNKAKRQAYLKEYYKNNKEKIKAASNARYIKLKEEKENISAYDKYYEEHKEEVVELHKKAVVSGAYFKLKDVNGYNTHVSTESNMKLNGGFYIHDDNIKNGRVKISKSRNDKYLCFVNVEDLNRNK